MDLRYRYLGKHHYEGRALKNVLSFQHGFKCFPGVGPESETFHHCNAIKNICFNLYCIPISILILETQTITLKDLFFSLESILDSD